MNRREIIKYGIGVVGGIATNVFGNENNTPVIKDYDNKVIRFKAYIKERNKIYVDVLVVSDIKHIFGQNTTDFVGIMKTENWVKTGMIDWIVYQPNQVLVWNKQNHNEILDVFGIEYLSCFPYSRYLYEGNYGEHPFFEVDQ